MADPESRRARFDALFREHHPSPAARIPIVALDASASCHRAQERPAGVFSYYNKQVEIHDPARKHSVADHAIVHAIDHALAIEDAGEDPTVGCSSARTPLATCLR